MKAKQHCIVVLAGLALVAIPASSQEQSRTWNFDGTPAGTLRTGFIAGPGEWKVQANSTAPSKPTLTCADREAQQDILFARVRGHCWAQSAWTPFGPLPKGN